MLICIILWCLFRYNIITVLFLALFDIPNIGTQWLSYVLPISCFAVIPLLLVITEEYNRRNVDDDETLEQGGEPLDANENIYNVEGEVLRD